MKRLNLLNRGVLLLFRGMDVLMKVSGLHMFAYQARDRRFVAVPKLRTYAVIVCSLVALQLLVFMFAVYLTAGLVQPQTHLLYVDTFSKMMICLLARWHQFAGEQEFIGLLNEIFAIVQEIRALARRPNMFRWSHLLLCLLALQSMLRSMSTFNLPAGSSMRTPLRAVFQIWMCVVMMSIFVAGITMILLALIGLVACYDELHLCTRRISQDVRLLSLRPAVVDRQRQVWLRRLRSTMARLIAVRARMYRATSRLLIHFRFHLLLALQYWVWHEVMAFALDQPGTQLWVYYSVWIALLNLAFYCTIFDIFVWKSKLSRSFWSFHLLNYSKEFDKTVDEFVHRELIEDVQVSAYGLRLDMRLFFRVFLLTYTYLSMHFVYKRQF